MAITFKDLPTSRAGSAHGEDAACSERQEREIPAGFTTLGLALSSLESTVDALLDRLSPVLRTSNTETDADKADPAFTDVGISLRIASSKVQQAEKRLADALQRLEV